MRYVWETQRWFRSLHNNLIQLGSNALFSDLTLKMRKFIWPVIFTGWFCSVFSPTRKIKWDWSFELRHDLPIPLLSWKQKKEPMYYRTLFKIQSPSRTNSTIVYCSLHTYMHACMYVYMYVCVYGRFDYQWIPMIDCWLVCLLACRWLCVQMYVGLLDAVSVFHNLQLCAR